MTFAEFVDLLVDVIKTHLSDLSLAETIAVLKYDGRFDDEELASQVVARDKVIMVDVSEVTFDAKPASEKVFNTSYSVEVAVYVALSSVTDANKTRYSAIDVCRSILQMLFVYAPVTAAVGVQSHHATYRPATTGTITKVFQTTSGYSVAKLELSYQFVERWKE